MPVYHILKKSLICFENSNELTPSKIQQLFKSLISSLCKHTTSHTHKTLTHESQYSVQPVQFQDVCTTIITASSASPTEGGGTI